VNTNLKFPQIATHNIHILKKCFQKQDLRES